MSRRPHPIDEAFRQKLKHHASDTPEHLWEGINRQRNMRRKVHLRWRERALLVAALLLFVYASVLTWHLQQMRPALSSFPIATNQHDLNSYNNAQTNITSDNNINETLYTNSISTPIAPQVKIVEPLPSIATEVESLTEQMTTTIEQLTEQQSLVIPATALSAFHLSALPLTLQQVSRRNALPFDYSKCAAFSDHKARFYFDMLASPDFTFRNIEPKTGDFKDYAANRKETESARYNYSTGVRLSVVSSGGLALRGGLNYSEINERFEWLTGTRIIITYDQNGNIIGSPDTISEKIVTNNRYQTLDIPIMVGYEIPIKKLTLAFNGGAYFNLQFKPKGEFLSPYDNRPISFSNEETPENNLPAFRENLGIGWYGSVGVSYKISPRMQLLVEPHLKMYPRSFTRDDFMTDQKYLTAGVFVGLRHQFAL